MFSYQNLFIQVNKYLENYERALSGFEAAASRDPGLNSTEEVRKIVNLLDKLESLLRVMSSSFTWPFQWYTNIVDSADIEKQ